MLSGPETVQVGVGLFFLFLCPIVYTVVNVMVNLVLTNLLRQTGPDREDNGCMAR